ncbi:FAD-binding oxidoreductase [Nocardioides sp. KC13]|uniref:FAD-binding oxidoreductase n=1 Tax=Nocardioides turkmenicus TaxID=2711220 RepID=A0A6M1R8S1_9ACTN|nr:FAD-dependent oxidoreductase [Nocardioides sp. KC13]NGN95992.1 FAD-binding oxidoreductase [Nocardioides sp. KC13]
MTDLPADLPADLTAELPTEADVAICGAGPIGAATAYFLARKSPGLRIVVLSDDPADDPGHVSTYRYSGGSIRWTWADPVKREMTTETAEFVQSLLADGVDLAAIENTYHLLHTGEHIPALNISASRLVSHLLERAAEAGAQIVPRAVVEGVRPDGSGHLVDTTRGTIRAERVLVALGAANALLFPETDAELEKRQLFVLDLPVPPERERMPHTIVPVGDGFGYAFVKSVEGRLRVLVGQEDIVEDDDLSGPVDHWDTLLERGLATALPWLREAQVDQILWGVDIAQKKLVLDEPAPGLLLAGCGSSVRSSAWLGRTLAERLAA